MQKCFKKMLVFPFFNYFNSMVLTSVLPLKTTPTAYSVFFHWIHQKLLKLFILYEKLCFHEYLMKKVCDNSGLKQLEITVNRYTVQFIFKKIICEFSKETNCKTDVKCRPPWLGNKKHFSL